MKEGTKIENMRYSEVQEPSAFRLIITLAMAGLLAGLLISGVNLYTRPMIAANKAEALKKAIFQVLPGCTEYEPLVLADGVLGEFEITKGSGSDQETIGEIFAGYDSLHSFLGFAVVADEPGFQDVVQGIFGYSPGEKIIVGFEVLESRETPGLGDKIIKDPEFRQNFAALATEPEVIGVKKGEKSQQNQVEMITGATISSKTVILILNKGLSKYRRPMEVFAVQKSSN